MIDWTKAEIRNGCNRDITSQFDQLNNKIDKVSETLTDKFNSEIDNVSKIVQDRLNFQGHKVVKLDDKFIRSCSTCYHQFKDWSNDC